MNSCRWLSAVFCLCLLAALPYAACAAPAGETAHAPGKAPAGHVSKTPSPETPGGSVHVVDENAGPQTWNLVADKLTSLGDGAVLEAEGKVFMQRGLDYLKADYARYYPSTNWVYLRGSVDVRMGKDVIKAKEAEFDLRSRTGWLTDGDIFMEGPHMYFTGGRIIKHRGDRYTFHQAKITACDGDVPAWSVIAEEATVEIDGYARLYRSAFQVADTPVLASPFMIVPAKTTRQSGFLMPDYGISSKRGLYYTQPYFQVIDESRDMTFFATAMEKAGFMGSVQYRSQTTEKDKTWLMVSGLSAKNVVRSPEDDPTDNGLSRTNWNRYWLRGMADGYVGDSPWRYRMDLDFVSDQNYLREFSGGPIGFDASRQATLDMFGRDLREDAYKRLSIGTIYRDWERVGVSMSARYEQDARLAHGNIPASSDETVQQLPRLDAFLYKGRIVPEAPLEIEMQASTAYMYRREGTKGGRSEFYPRVSLPWDLKYASLLSTIGWRQTMYNTASTSNTDPLSPFEPSPLARQTGTYRSIPDIDVQLYTEAGRNWNLEGDTTLKADKESVGKTDWIGLRHQIQPRVRYQALPNVDQHKNPYYFSDDRINSKNELTYSITNVITRKAKTVTQVPGKKGEEPSYILTDTYQDLLWWKLEAGYDQKEAGRSRYRDQYSRRPFMDVYSEMELYPLSWLSYTNKTYFSPYTAEISRTDNSVNLSPWNWITVGVGHSYRTGDYEIRQRLKTDQYEDIVPEAPLSLLYNSVQLTYDNTWGIDFREYRNLRTHDVYDQRVDLSYTAQCYRFIVRMTSNDTERSFGFYVELPGLFE